MNANMLQVTTPQSRLPELTVPRSLLARADEVIE
jgi:hypothetical protein